MRRYSGAGHFQAMTRHADKIAQIYDDYAHDTTKMSRKALERLIKCSRLSCIDMAMLKLELKLAYNDDSSCTATDRLINRLLGFRDRYLKIEVATKINEIVDLCSTDNVPTMNANQIFQVKKFVSDNKKYICLVIRASFISFKDTEKAKEYDEMNDDNEAKRYSNNRRKLIEKIGQEYRKRSGYDDWKMGDNLWPTLTGEDQTAEVKAEPGIKRDRDGQVEHKL